MQILAFGASNHRNSINKSLAAYAANIVKIKHDNSEVEVIDLNSFIMPIYSEDYEQDNGIPPAAHLFYNKITNANLLIISFAEHNGSYTAAYKNIFDWTSRINQKIFQDKKVVALSTSPSKNGGASVLASFTSSAKYFGAQLVANMSIGSFYEVFDQKKNILTDAKIKSELEKILQEI